MKPRLSSSKKWTPFPKEYVTQIEDVFKQGFGEKLTEGKLVIEGRIYPEEVLLRVGYVEKGRLKQANFEVSMNYSQKDKDAIDRIHNCIDAAASMMNEYIENEGEVDFPMDWKEFEFEGKALYIQYSTINSKLESEADKLLGKSFEEMVAEDAETEDALELAEESIEDEELETVEPTMFSHPKKKKKEDLH